MNISFVLLQTMYFLNVMVNMRTICVFKGYTESEPVNKPILLV